jgi:hypothetical protein
MTDSFLARFALLSGMSVTPITAGRSPSPAQPRTEPLRTPSGAWWPAAELTPCSDAADIQQPAQTGVLPAKRMALSVLLASGNLLPESDDFRLAVELFPPTLTTPAFTSFLRFDRCHRCPPSGLS